MLVAVFTAMFAMVDMVGAEVTGLTDRSAAAEAGLGWMSLALFVLTEDRGEVIVMELGRMSTCCWGTITGAMVAVPGSTTLAGEESGCVVAVEL